MADPLETPPGKEKEGKETPAPEKKKRERGEVIVCEFCECELAPSGEYKNLSDRAKELRSVEDRNKALTAEVEALKKENADLKAKSAPSEAPPKKKLWGAFD